MVEQSQSYKSLLAGSALPSIGCFLTVLQFYNGKKDVKKLLMSLSKKHGHAFFDKHVKHSVEFSNLFLIPEHLPQLVTLDFSLSHQVVANLVRFKLRSGQEKIYLNIKLKVTTDINYLIRMMNKFPTVKFYIREFYMLDKSDINIISYSSEQVQTIADIFKRAKIIQRLVLTPSYIEQFKLLFAQEDFKAKYDQIYEMLLYIAVQQLEIPIVDSLPKNLQSLSINIEKTFKMKAVKMHNELANYVGKSNTLKILALSNFTIFCAEIENAWEKALIDNESVVDLTLNSFYQSYSQGDKIFNALKQGKTRLQRFTLHNTQLSEYNIYNFTAFIRKHLFFQEFTLSERCFEELKEAKALPIQNGQQANFNVVDQILAKDVRHLKFCINDEHMFHNAQSQNIIQNVLEKFQGSRLTLQYSKLLSISLKNIFVQNTSLTHIELNKVNFGKSAQKESLFQALWKQPNLTTIVIKECNIDDSDLSSVKHIHDSKQITYLHFENLAIFKVDNIVKLLSLIGQQLRKFIWRNNQTLSQHHAQMISNLSCSQNLEVLELTSTQPVTHFKNKEETQKNNKIICHFLSGIKYLCSFIGTFELIDDVLLDQLGETLQLLAPSLQRFEIKSNGVYDGGITQYQDLKSISSDTYDKIIKESPQQIEEKYQIFAKGLSLCTKLHTITLPYQLLKKPFFDAFNPHLNMGDYESNLIRIRSSSYRPEEQYGYFLE